MRVVAQDMQVGDPGMKAAAPDTKIDKKVYSLEKTKAADSAGELEVLTDVGVAVEMAVVEAVEEAVDIVPVLVQLV